MRRLASRDGQEHGEREKPTKPREQLKAEAIDLRRRGFSVEDIARIQRQYGIDKREVAEWTEGREVSS